MGNEDLFKDKHKKKHKKEKSKKHKKEKYKKHKKDKKSKYSDSKNSDSDTSSSDVSVKNETREKHSEVGTEWGFLDTALSDSFVTVKNRKEKSARPLPEKPGQNIRELNPYWKDGGCGLPPPKPEKVEKEDSFSSYYKSRHESQQGDKKKLNFLKPGESLSYDLGTNVVRGNWRKKDVTEPESSRKQTRETEFSGKHKTEVESGEKRKSESSENIKTESAKISDEELNKLAAKLVKAEIMGNTNLVNKLKAELESAKKAKSESSEDSTGKGKEVVIVSDRSLKKSHDDKSNYVAKKKQKLATHESGQRICYFPDDNKYSLKNLFEKEKNTSGDDIMLPSKLSSKNSEDFDDVCLDAAASTKMHQKMEEKRKQRDIKEAIVKHEKLEGCPWCLDNRNATKHLIVSTGTKCYLCLPERQSLTEGHCIIVPIQHEISTMHLDEDVWSEIKTYQRLLTKMFSEEDQDVVFFENARSFKHFPHSFIQCVPLSKEMGELAPLYFQKAISESETEWTNNKKLIDFREKDLRRSIPKGLPYFAITFGTSGGFAHIIEDEYLFKRNFAEEVLGGMMDLDHRKWRNKEKDDFRIQRQKTLEFLKHWKKFEFNEKSDSDSESSSSD